MQENFLHFLSNTPTNIECNGEHIGFIDNEKVFEVDLLTHTNHIFITNLPVSKTKQSIPYTFKLSTENTPYTENEYIKVIPFPNNNYDIIMKPFYYYQLTDTKVLYNGNIGNYFLSITCNNKTNISIFSGASIIFNHNTERFNNVKVEKKQDIMIITGLTDNNSYTLLIIDCSDFTIIYEDKVQSIEANENNITSYKTLPTLCAHAKVCNINFDTKKSEKYYVYQDEFPLISFNNMLIPRAFLECIQVEDEQTSKAFLDKKIYVSTLQDFQGYFGKIEAIYLNRHNTDNHKVNYTIKSNDGYRNFNFLMDNNKIYEIEEIF